MKLKIYQIDAFADKIFSGNPAGVVPLDEWLSDELMQKIAMENNLAETVFYVKDDERYQIRWFTPSVEVDLCGHATLAAAYVLFNLNEHQGNLIEFFSPRSGKLSVARENELLTLNFPTDIYSQITPFDELTEGFELKPSEVLRGKTDYMFVYENEEQIQTFVPNLPLISKLEARGLIITAKGDNSDFVSRFFGPQSGIDEDPVTGSAHTTLTPYWAERLDKNALTAVQLSKRKGTLKCKYLNERVEISGQCKLYLIGEIYAE